MAHKIQAQYLHHLPVTNTPQIGDIILEVMGLIRQQSETFLPNTPTNPKERKRIINVRFMIGEIVENILDAHAQNIEISCVHCPERDTMQITFIDDGDGIHALESKQKRKKPGYFGGEGLGEEIIESMSHSRPLFPHKATWRKKLGIPYGVFSGYRRYSHEHGSKTILVIK